MAEDTLTDKQREEIMKILKPEKNEKLVNDPEAWFKIVKDKPTPKQVCFYKFCCCCFHCCGNRTLSKCAGCLAVTFILPFAGLFMYGIFLASTEAPVCNV